MAHDGNLQKKNTKLVLPSGHLLRSTVEARTFAWPAYAVSTTSIMKPESCRRSKFKCKKIIIGKGTKEAYL
jgi:hypothetical protein